MLGEDRQGSSDEGADTCAQTRVGFSKRKSRATVGMESIARQARWVVMLGSAKLKRKVDEKYRAKRPDEVNHIRLKFLQCQDKWSS